MEFRGGLSLLFFQTFIALNSVYAHEEGDRACEKYKSNQDTTLCTALHKYNDHSDEYKSLSHEGIMGIKYSIHPPDVNYASAIITYDEPLYPIPVGSSVYFIFSLTLILCWYFATVGRLCLRNVKTKLLLHPETGQFPYLPLYWLQQSRRELSLKREVRHTWAWLARRYLMSPDDKMLHDVDEVMGLIGWKDFAVPRDTWSFLNIILKVNQLYLTVQKGPNGEEVLVFNKDKDYSHLNPFASVPESYIPTDLALRYAQLGEDDDSDSDSDSDETPEDRLARKKLKEQDNSKKKKSQSNKKKSGPLKRDKSRPPSSEPLEPAAELAESELEPKLDLPDKGKVIPAITIHKPSISEDGSVLPEVIITHLADGGVSVQLEYLPGMDLTQMYEILVIDLPDGKVEFRLKKVKNHQKKVKVEKTPKTVNKTKYLKVKSEIKKTNKKKKKKSKEE